MEKNGAAVSLGLLLLIFSLPPSAVGQTRAQVTVRLIDTLSTGSSQPGDSFTATLATPLVVNDRIVAEKDTRVTGQVRDVVSSGRLKRPAMLTLSLKSVQAPSHRIPLETGYLTIKADSHATRNLLIIGGAAGTGAAIGGAAGGGKGAAIGAAAGAGAGVAGAYLTGKREIVLPAETLLTFHVNSVVISPQELAQLQRVSYPEEDVPIVVKRRRHHHDDDEDDDDDEYEHEFEHPRRIYVVFLKDHHARVRIHWPRRVEHITLKGDDLDDIMEDLAKHTRHSAKFLRVKIKVDD